ncbi:MAG: 50S ribosomal protein L17 [Verrucomicrobiae bacterium]|nr:50S ribosomal protein L17 [Verrucomicrobiae bacterium]MDA7654112.1 50S ribosomal protein L17 [Verrucomicrobiota bacterium]MDA7668015.1 50S ribosomal protein L17 [Verrucomicrobiota bacterium]MDB4589415.1 50S ribosomal protein L17 [bacterium]
MRHLKRNAKLGRKGAHRNAMLANMVCSLIKNKRVTTTLAKAKAVRPVAEKMVTLGKKGSIHHRRLAASRLHQEDAVQILFNEIAPGHQDRPGGYTRIIKLHERRGDAAQMAMIEFVESSSAAEADGSSDSTSETAAETPTTTEASATEAPATEAPATEASATEAPADTASEETPEPDKQEEEKKDA